MRGPITVSARERSDRQKESWYWQGMQRGQHIVPDETVLTKVSGTVIVPVQSDIQVATYCALAFSDSIVLPILFE